MYIKLNEFHSTILKDYADGDHRHLADKARLTKSDLKDIGDPLLAFLLVELSTEEECQDLETAISRTTRARDDLDVCLLALQRLQDAVNEKTGAPPCPQ